MTTTDSKINILPDGRMDAKNAALYLGLSPRSLAQFRCSGKGPQYVKMGKIFYFKDCLDAWIDSKRRINSAQSRLKEGC